MISLLEHVVTCHTISNVRKKSCHATRTLFGNVAFISNRIDDINIRIYRDMSNVLNAKRKKGR